MFPGGIYRYPRGDQAGRTDAQAYGHQLARAMAVIVARPDLIRVSCRTPRQMVLANALYRAWEARG
ncbi:MAG: hypothetical protein ACRDOU_11755 [Streptosporangiaceae bacterium]